MPAVGASNENPGADGSERRTSAVKTLATATPWSCAVTKGKSLNGSHSVAKAVLRSCRDGCKFTEEKRPAFKSKPVALS